MVFLNQFMIYLATFGFGFAVVNSMIGISYIRDLNELTLKEVKFHKLFGRIGMVIFYLLSVLCIIFATIPRLNPTRFSEIFQTTVFFHTLLGGLIAFILFTCKIIIARYYKETIYKYGKYLGPTLGFGGWALAYFTSTIDFYFFVSPIGGIPTPILIPNYWISLIISIFFGIILYLLTKYFKYRKYGNVGAKKSLHGVAMILHGISFGYEGSVGELVGTPVLYKYVFPKTYQFLERYAERIGLDMEELKKKNLNEAMEMVMKKFSEIGLAENLIIDWISDNEFTIESINCSTSVVRSYMKPDELQNSICPWAILAATIVNSLTGKDLEIGLSKFNKIGAKTKLKIVEKKN